MTVTVIIIIAIIVVLAVLVLLLLGMRAMNIGSHEDEYEDEYDEASEEDHDRGRQREDDEEPAPRGRARRARQDGGGRAERRPRKRRRDEDWDDDPDSMSDNDFWSSLSEDGPESSRARNEDRSPSVTAYEYEDDYDDFPEQESGPPGATTVMPAARGGEIGPAADLAMLASLGQSSGPQVPEQADRPSREDDRNRHGQGAPGDRALPPGTREPERSALPPAPSLPSAPTPTEPARPIAPAASTSDDPLGPGPWSSSTPSSTSAHDDPLGVSPRAGYGASPYDSGTMSRSDLSGVSPSSERSPSDDPLAPSFRPASSDPALESPIWSTLDTGSHQRSDLGFGGPGPASEPTASPRPTGDPHDPLSGGYRPPSTPSYDSGAHSRTPYDTGAHTRPSYDTGSFGHGAFDTGAHTRSPYDSGAHSQPSYDTGGHSRAAYDTGSYQRSDLGFGGPGPASEPTTPSPRPTGDPLSSGYPPPSTPSYDTGSFGHDGPDLPGRNAFDTGAHTRTPYDTSAHARPSYDTGSFGHGAFDTGAHTRSPYDSGAHARAPYQDPNPPLWGGQEGGALPRTSSGTGGLGGGTDMDGTSLPVPGVPSSFDQGPGGPPAPTPAPGLPEDALGYPYGPQSTSGYATDRMHGNVSPGLHSRQGFDHPTSGSGGGYPDPLDGGHPSDPRAGRYGSRLAGEDWPSGGEDHYPSGPQASGRYPTDPYGAPGHGREGYEGGYEDGRFI